MITKIDLKLSNFPKLEYDVTKNKWLPFTINKKNIDSKKLKEIKNSDELHLHWKGTIFIVKHKSVTRNKSSL